MCNKEIKFGMFYNWAMKNRFDAVATGHYAQIVEVSGKKWLARGKDQKKDQSYFLYVLNQPQLHHILFPIGHFEKSEVRLQAKTAGLPVASKPDSQGICFIGEIDVHGFLRDRLGENPGEVVNTRGEIIGNHKGLWFYTIGQRHGFSLLPKVRKESGEWKEVIPPFYVISKDVAYNRLVVGFGQETLKDSFDVRALHWIDADEAEHIPSKLSVRIRHGGKLYPCEVIFIDDVAAHVKLNEKIMGIAEGQSAVFYDGEACLGGGVIE